MPALTGCARSRTPRCRGTARSTLEGDIPAARVHGLRQQLPTLTRGEGVVEGDLRPSPAGSRRRPRATADRPATRSTGPSTCSGCCAGSASPRRSRRTRRPGRRVHRRRSGRFEQPLREHDHDQVAGRVDQPGRAQAAVPSEGARVGDRLAERPRPAREEVLSKAAVCLLLRGELVGGHRPGAGLVSAPVSPRRAACGRTRAGRRRSIPVRRRRRAKAGGRLHLPPGSSHTTRPSGVGW